MKLGADARGVYPIMPTPFHDDGRMKADYELVREYMKGAG